MSCPAPSGTSAGRAMLGCCQSVTPPPVCGTYDQRFTLDTNYTIHKENWNAPLDAQNAIRQTIGGYFPFVGAPAQDSDSTRVLSIVIHPGTVFRIDGVINAPGLVNTRVNVLVRMPGFSNFYDGGVRVDNFMLGGGSVAGSRCTAYYLQNYNNSAGQGPETWSNETVVNPVNGLTYCKILPDNRRVKVWIEVPRYSARRLYVNHEPNFASFFDGVNPTFPSDGLFVGDGGPVISTIFSVQLSHGDHISVVSEFTSLFGIGDNDATRGGPWNLSYDTFLSIFCPLNGVYFLPDVTAALIANP